MRSTGTIWPAHLWRAFFVFGIAAAVAAAAVPSSPPPELAQIGKPDAAESARILAQFRRYGIVGYVEFELRVLPRRGDETVFRGRLWGGQNDEGAVTRIELTDANVGIRRLLLQNGERAALWRFADGRVTQLGVAALFEPLLPGVEITAFDLQMPYLYWPGATVERIVRVRGRPAFAFVFRPPAAFAAQHPALGSVRAYFDAQFGAPTQTDLTDARRVTKSTALNELKKVGEQWIPKSFDVRNEVTRDKTRFQITAVALNLDFGAELFAPGALAEAVRPPAADQLVRIAP